MASTLSDMAEVIIKLDMEERAEVVKCLVQTMEKFTDQTWKEITKAFEDGVTFGIWKEVMFLPVVEVYLLERMKDLLIRFSPRGNCYLFADVVLRGGNNDQKMWLENWCKNKFLLVKERSYRRRPRLQFGPRNPETIRFWLDKEYVLPLDGFKHAMDSCICQTEAMKACTFSKRIQHKLLLKLRPNDPSVWKERRSLVGETKSILRNQLELVSGYLQKHQSSWSSLMTSYEKSESLIAQSELKLAKWILSKGARNNQAWSYREWIILQFGRHLWRSELQYCHEILKKDVFNASAWDQICRAVRGLDYEMGKEWRLKEALFAKKVIRAQPGNEGPWIYLRVLYAQDKESLYTNPELECIYVDVLVEEAYRLEKVDIPAGYNAAKLEPGFEVEYSSVAHRGCVHALNLIMDLMFVGYKMNENTRLVDALSVLYAHACTTFHDAVRIRRTGEGIFWLVCAVTFSFGGSMIRYCHKYRGNSSFSHPQIFTKREPPFDMKAKCNTKRAPEKENTTFVEYSKWEIRQCDVKEKDDALKELEFTTKIIKNDAKNRCAWLHRQWLFQTFGGDWKDDNEIEFCRKILENDSYNIFAWDQRIIVATRFVKKIYAAQTQEMDFGDEEYEKVHAMGNSFLRRRKDEVGDVLKLIRSEPENPFPWCHILGLYRVFSGSYLDCKVRDAIVGILEDARDYALAYNLSDGIMGDGHVVVNARGIVNALNMILDYSARGFDIVKEGGEDLRNVIDMLCPDSWFSLEQLTRSRRFDTEDKVHFIFKRVDKALPEYGLQWKNAFDQLLNRLPSNL